MLHKVAGCLKYENIHIQSIIFHASLTERPPGIPSVGMVAITINYTAIFMINQSLSMVE
jgi:hypothetical protein